jgi:hypothetical protein
MRDSAQAAWSAWHGFWFTVSPAYTLGLVRIVFGSLIIFWTLELKTNFDVRFGSQGVVPTPYNRSWSWSVFDYFPSDDALFVGWVVLLVAAIALTIGCQSRLAAIVVFVLIMSFERRNPWVFNAGDMLLRVEALMIALAPCGAALSVDQWRRSGSFFSSRNCKQWALRLMQVQVSIIYISTVIAKLRGETWQNGTSVLYSLRQADMLVIQTPEWLTNNLLIMNAAAWGTLVVEFAIGVLVWNRRWRPWVLAAGVVLHLGITMSLEVGLFSFAIFVLYLAFVPNDRVKSGADWIQARLSRLIGRKKRLDGTPVIEPDDTSATVPTDGPVIRTPNAPAHAPASGRHTLSQPPDETIGPRLEQHRDSEHKDRESAPRQSLSAHP